MRSQMWYRTPAKNWINGLLIGNGRLAGNVFGDGSGERLGLNHECLFTAKYRERECQPGSIEHLPKIRAHLMRGEFYEATLLAMQTQSTASDKPGIRQRTDDYKPAGELVICPEQVENRDYIRALNLDTATARVSYDGVCYEYAADSVRDMILIHITGPLVAKVDLKFQKDDDLHVSVYRDGEKVRAVGEYAGGVFFESRVCVYADGGFDGKQLRVEKEAWLTVDVETGMDDPAAIARRLDERAYRPCGSFADVTAAHTEKYRAVMDRLTLELEAETGEDIPTDQRMAAFRQGGYDRTLLKTYFDFGHYLMYAGTVLGEMPMNLQGKWNREPMPPWHSDYHLDVNLQMNYWPAEAMGMGEAHLGMLSYIERMVPQAKKAARTRYDCGGIFMGITDDCWHRATVESTCCNMWPGVAAWLGQHFYRHFEYSGDMEFLRKRAYPYIKEVCAFFEDYLTEDERGVLQVIPSQSPENHFRQTFGPVTGGNPSVAISTAMDLSLVLEVLNHAIWSAKRLGVDGDKIALWEQMRARLQPMQVGSDGRLLEWDREMEEGLDPGHRHLSHLYGVYPGNFINEKDTPYLFEGAKKSYDFRLSHGSGHTGWSRSWCVNLDARFARAQAAFAQLRALIGTLTSDTLLDLLPGPDWGGPVDLFQIEGNFGGLAGMLEMLVGIQGERIRLLPALPKEMDKGSIRGVRLPGGGVCDLKWERGKLICGQITLGWSGEICLAGSYRVQPAEEDTSVSIRREKGQIYIQGAPGDKICILPGENQEEKENG